MVFKKKYSSAETLRSLRLCARTKPLRARNKKTTLCEEQTENSFSRAEPQRAQSLRRGHLGSKDSKDNPFTPILFRKKRDLCADSALSASLRENKTNTLREEQEATLCEEKQKNSVRETDFC